MKSIIFFLSLLLACGSCKNKMQTQDEPPVPLDASITGTWQLVQQGAGVYEKGGGLANQIIPVKDGHIYTFNEDLTFTTTEYIYSSCSKDGKTTDGSYAYSSHDMIPEKYRDLSYILTKDTKNIKVAVLKYRCYDTENKSGLFRIEDGYIVVPTYYTIQKSENEVLMIQYQGCFEGCWYIYKKL